LVYFVIEQNNSDTNRNIKVNSAAETKAKRRVSRIGIAANHGGFKLKNELTKMLRDSECEVVDFGAKKLTENDDYPDFVLPLAKAVYSGKVDRGIAICGSGVGACVVANKVAGVRASLIRETFSAHQGVEDDDMNIICLGGLVVGHVVALELGICFGLVFCQ
jgi:ribose 5-phosphate isomerase B